MEKFEAWLSRVVAGTDLLNGGQVDYLLVLAIGLAFPFLRLILDRTIFDYIARRVLAIPKDYKKKDIAVSLEQLETLDKFKESEYKCTAQILFTTVLLIVSLGQPWFSDSSLFWSICTRLPCDYTPALGERAVYCLMLGFYCQAVPMLFIWETKRRDRLESFAHHIATIILIGYSYYLNLTRVGIMVLMCHEVNDIFLEAAKMARYAKKEAQTTALFVVFMLSWFISRIFIFPLYIIRSTWYESQARADSIGVNIQPYHTVLNGFLIFLFVLHVYWSYLIVRIVVRQLTHGELDDIREHKDEPIKPKILNPTKTRSVSTLPSDM